MKMLFVGIDGLDSDRVLSSGGAFSDWGGLRGRCVPEIASTGPSWTTIYTGLKQEAHGVTSPWGLEAKPSLPYIWKQLDSCGVIGMPVTYPAHKLDDGWMLSGLPSPSSDLRARWPRDLDPGQYISDYTNILHPAKADIGRWTKPTTPEQAWESMKKVAWSHIGNAARLYRERPVESLFVGFTFPDRWGHTVISGGWGETWRGWSPVDELARRLVYEARAAFDPDLVVIVSDHGFDNGGHTDAGIFLMSGKSEDIELHNWDVKGMIIDRLGET